MTKLTQTYQLSVRPGTLLHTAGKYWLVRDVDEPLERERLKIRLRSGDYLGQLASDLDEIGQMITDDNEQQSIMLQQVVEDLLYLDRHYHLAPK